MSDYQPRVWKCEQCGVILGIVRRDSGRRLKLDVLHLQDWICKPAAEIVAEATRESFAVVDLQQGTVRCQRCGAERTWYMGDQAIDDLVANRKKRSFGLEVEHA